jgi:tetratricopeptide (TPR) repeat protein
LHRRLNPLHPIWYNFGLGIALYSMGRYAEAAEAFRHRPNLGLWSSARLAACYAQLGDRAKAVSLVRAVLDARHDFSTEVFLARDVLLERAEDREHLRQGLRKAGLPE